MPAFENREEGGLIKSPRRLRRPAKKSSRSRVASSVILLTVVGILLAACRSGAPSSEVVESPAAVEATAEVETEKILTIYNWDTYMDPELLAAFEERFGATIDYQTFESDEQVLSELRAGPVEYDVIVPSAPTATILRREELLHPLNKENIPNFDNIDFDLFLDPVYDPGNRYCLPYQWGTAGIGYNLEATGKEIRSLADLFDPAYAGRVALIDDPRDTLGLILLYLGYSVNTTDPAEIAEARDFLMEHADHIAAYAGDDGQKLLVEGVVDLAVEWNGDILQVMPENPDIRYVVPQEGSLLWTDVMCIPAGAPQKELAERFMNYLLEPEVGAALSEYVQYASPNEAALPLINETDRQNPALYPLKETQARLFFIDDLGDETNALYRRAWAEVLAHHEQQTGPE